jgi:hypothetical protein
VQLLQTPLVVVAQAWQEMELLAQELQAALAVLAVAVRVQTELRAQAYFIFSIRSK